MNQLKHFMEFSELEPDLEFEAHVLAHNNKEAELLIKKGYKIKKPLWSGLIAS